jgi:hypothetical protein
MKPALILCLFFSFSQIAAAQEPSPAAKTQNEVPRSVSTAIEQVSDVDARFVVQAVDRNNSPQQTDPFLHRHRTGSITQNAARIVQDGSYNVTDVLQFGTRNVASIRITGDQNVIDAAQLGGDNVLGVHIEGSNNRLPIRQYNLLGWGNELSIELLGVSGARPSFPITQIGGGIPLRIQVRGASYRAGY